MVLICPSGPDGGIPASEREREAPTCLAPDPRSDTFTVFCARPTTPDALLGAATQHTPHSHTAKLNTESWLDTMSYRELGTTRPSVEED